MAKWQSFQKKMFSRKNQQALSRKIDERNKNLDENWREMHEDE